MISGFNHFDLGVVEFALSQTVGTKAVYVAQYPELDSELFTNKKPSIITIDGRLPEFGSLKVSLVCSCIHDEGNSGAMVGAISGILGGNIVNTEIVIQKKSAVLFLTPTSLG